MIKKGLPYYPNFGEAIAHLFELHIDYFDSFGNGYVIIPDYRARIDLLKMMFSKVELKIDSPEIKYDDLLLTVFTKSGTQRKTIPDIEITDGIVEIDVDFQTDTLKAVLFTPKDNLKIDEKEFTKYRSEREGILVERPEGEILSLIKSGESQRVEYNYSIERARANNIRSPDQKLMRKITP